MEELDVIEQAIRAQQNKYYGKYRAFVTDNGDPEKRGRCRLTIPSVLGEVESDWALPCVAYGGGTDFGLIAVPPVGSQVLAEFLEGDPSAPLWTGTFWRTAGEPPAEFSARGGPSAKVLKTESGHVLVFEDQDQDEKVTLRSKAQAILEMDAKGSLSLTDANGARVRLDADGQALQVEDANGNSMVMTSSGITLKDPSGNEITTASSGINLKGAAITIEGDAIAIGGAGGEPLLRGQTFLKLFASHTHNCTGAGSPSGPPLPQPEITTALTTKGTAS